MSKGLEALKYLKENKRKHWLDGDNSNECLKTIEEELKEKDELAQALSIAACENGELLKYKKVLGIIRKYIKVDKPFNSACYIYLNDESEMITQEEYDLLNEVLL